MVVLTPNFMLELSLVAQHCLKLVRQYFLSRLESGQADGLGSQLSLNLIDRISEGVDHGTVESLLARVVAPQEATQFTVHFPGRRTCKPGHPSELRSLTGRAKLGRRTLEVSHGGRPKRARRLLRSAVGPIVVYRRVGVFRQIRRILKPLVEKRNQISPWGLALPLLVIPECQWHLEPSTHARSSVVAAA